MKLFSHLQVPRTHGTEVDAAANLESALDMEELRVLEEDWTNVLQPTLNQKCMKFPKKLEAGTRKLQHYYLQRNTFLFFNGVAKEKQGVVGGVIMTQGVKKLKNPHGICEQLPTTKQKY